MKKSQIKSWPRILAEGSAIVASILLAFAIDAWWQERQDRDEEQEILRGLDAEFSSIQGILASDMDEHLQRLQSLEKLLMALESGSTEKVIATVDDAILEMLSPSTSDLGSGALDALLNSGRVEMLRNETLRKKLAGWGGVWGEVWDDQNDGAGMVYDTFIPYFIEESIPAGRLMRNWYADWPLLAKSVSDDLEVVNRLLADSKFRVMLELRFGYKMHLTGELEAAISEADAILAEIAVSLK
jgi:hypothetical protein